MRNFSLPLLALILICGIGARFELAEVSLLSPSDRADSVPVSPTLSWSPVEGSESYRLEISRKRNMKEPVIEMHDIYDTSTSLPVPLDENTTYYWRARAVASEDTGPWSRVWSFKTGNLPSDVSLTDPPNQSADVDLRPDFSWSGASGADSYDLEIATSNQFSEVVFSQEGVAGTRFKLPTSLQEETRFYWHVRGSNDIGDGNFSSPSWFETRAVASSPSQVALVYPGDGASGVETALTFSWAATDGAETYRIEVAPTSDFTTPLIDELGIISTSFDVPLPLLNGAVFYWRVRATNSLGDGPISPIYAFTTEVGGSTQVNLVSPPDESEDVELTPTLSWQPVDGASGYRVQVSTRSDFGGNFIHDTIVNGTQFQIGPLTLGLTYYWRIRASNAGTINWSETFSFDTGANAPAQITLISPADGAVGQPLAPVLSWAESDLAETYNLQIALSSDFATILVSESGLAGTSYMAEDLEPSSEYYWRVQGVNAVGSGPWSAGSRFTTRIVLAPDAPMLIYPPDEAEGVATDPVLSWNESEGAVSYKLELSTSPPDELENFITVVTVVVVAQPFFQSPDLSSGQTHYWRVEARNEAGSARSAVRTFTTAAVTASEPDEIPTDFSLEQNYPNPFNPTTRITYALAEPSAVYLTISDVNGRHVATIVSRDQPAGVHEVVWSGKADDGSPVASGIYLYRLSTPDFTRVRRMVVAK